MSMQTSSDRRNTAMLKTSKLLIVAAALLGSTALASANENTDGVSMYIPQYGNAGVSARHAPASKPSAAWSAEELMFENAKRLD
jgi:hypothetical protein